MKKILLLAVSVFAFTISSFAQKKMGYLNTQEILQSMPESKKVNEDLEKYLTQLEGELKGLYDEYQLKVKKYQDDEPKLSESMKEVRVKEIRSLEETITSFREGSQEKLQKKEAELVNPLLDKIKKAIESVGKDNGYDYIFNAAALEYAKDSENVTTLVKSKLGIK